MNSETPNRFHPLTMDEEMKLLENDSPLFSRAQLYLAPLVDQACDTAKVPEAKRPEIRARILSQVALAAERFLANRKPGREYTFATYFTWYIQQEIG